jgi:hypothetical protein
VQWQRTISGSSYHCRPYREERTSGNELREAETIAESQSKASAEAKNRENQQK